MSVAVYVAIASGMMLWYVYAGYLQILRLLARWSKAREESFTLDADPPTVAVYFSALNEQDRVVERLENIFAQDYPPAKLEVIAVSDGSKDGTVERMRAYAARFPEHRLTIVESAVNRGQAAAQNLVARTSSGEILIKTDADAEFPADLVRRMAAPFSDNTVGVVGCVARYRNVTNGLAEDISSYRQMEWQIRRYEGMLDVMAKTDGACTAYRRTIWDEIEDFEDVDHVAILMARRAGLRAVHLSDLYYWDSTSTKWRQELKARARMTRKGLFSITKRWKLSDVERDPLFSLALFSHRHARLFSPLYLLAFAGSVLVWAVQAGRGREMALVTTIAVGALVVGTVLRVPVVGRVGSKLWNFLLANIGFALGIAGWISGNRTGHYRPTRSLA